MTNLYNDSAGNRLTQTFFDSAQNGVVTKYVYDNANRLTSVNGQTYTWDNNGNLLSDGVNTYTYDQANRLIAISHPQSAISHQYNGVGDRLQQTVGGVTTNYALDPSTALGTGLNAGLTQVLADGTNNYLYGVGRIAQYDNYTPRPSTVFSGVYDPETGVILMRPSGNTRLANGQIPNNLVDRQGGHGFVNYELGRSGANRGQTLAFTVYYESEGILSVDWLSRSVNGANYGSPYAPAEFREAIILALQRETRMTVISR